MSNIVEGGCPGPYSYQPPPGSMQMFVDLLGGEWHTCDAAGFPADMMWSSVFENAGYVIGLNLLHKPRSSHYVLVALEGPNGGRPADVKTYQAEYRNDAEALAGTQSWVDFLDKGGTVAAWLAHYQGQ